MGAVIIRVGGCGFGGWSVCRVVESECVLCLLLGAVCLLPAAADVPSLCSPSLKLCIIGTCKLPNCCKTQSCLEGVRSCNAHLLQPYLRSPPPHSIPSNPRKAPCTAHSRLAATADTTLLLTACAVPSASPHVALPAAGFFLAAGFFFFLGASSSSSSS